MDGKRFEKGLNVMAFFAGVGLLCLLGLIAYGAVLLVEKIF